MSGSINLTRFGRHITQENYIHCCYFIRNSESCYCRVVERRSAGPLVPHLLVFGSGCPKALVDYLISWQKCLNVTTTTSTSFPNRCSQVRHGKRFGNVRLHNTGWAQSPFAFSREGCYIKHFRWLWWPLWHDREGSLPTISTVHSLWFSLWPISHVTSVTCL